MNAHSPLHRDGSVDAGGLRLHYMEWECSGPPLVLLHGLGDSAQSWAQLASALGTERRVIALDHRGHGDSQWASPGSYRLEDYVSDVEALVDQVGVHGCVLIGHSEGGRSAVAYAARNPQNVEALIVVDGDLNAADQESISLLAGTPGEWGSLDAVARHLRGLQPGSTYEALALQASYLTVGLPKGRRAWKRDPAVLAAYQQPELWDQWRRLRCPTLVARGRQSSVLTHEVAVRMREALGKSRLAELEGGGHWFHQEIPGAFEAMVRWFLQDLPS